MRNLYVLIILLLVISCGIKKKPVESQIVEVVPIYKTVESKKVVKALKQTTKTVSEHEFSVWKGDFVLVPKVYPVYYMVYTDGSYEEVEEDKFIIASVGDTIVFTRQLRIN